MTKAIVSNPSIAQRQVPRAMFPTPRDTSQATANLSHLVLFTILVAGFVLTQGNAELNPGLTDLFLTLLQ